MARMPSFEESLSQVRESLGLVRDPQERRFTDFDLQLDNHSAMLEKMLVEIFAALDLDKQACGDALRNLIGWADSHKALELNTWTGNASQQQVLWHMLAYSYVPTLARGVAFWSLHNIERSLPAFDAGMPGGRFWFLPYWDKKNDRIEMPLPQVIKWLLDLLGSTSVNALADSIGNKKSREKDGKDSAVRTLQNWLAGSLPKSAEMIEQIFPDDAVLKFSGVFSCNDELALTERFEAALNFVAVKNLNAEALHDEIPMTIARLEAIFDGSAPEEEKKEFVKCIALRYAAPTMRTIRLRLRVARMMQDGCQRLLKSLCPDVEITCTDPNRNKLLQLVGLFETIYSLTIQSYKNADSVEAQDAWFEAHLTPWDKADLLLFILPSQREVCILRLAERLNQIFTKLEQDSPLENLIPWDKESALPIIKRSVLRIQQGDDENKRLEGLIARVRGASPWRALQAENNYSVLIQFAQREDLSQKIRDMLVLRLRELAETDGNKVEVALVELGYLLNCESRHRPKDVMPRVISLLDQTKSSAGYDEWKAPLLRFSAKHRLFQNDLDGAVADFKKALAACSERGFGGLRGEIARDGFATEIVKIGFIPKNQEKYYRNMRDYMAFPNGVLSFEDAAVECEGFFWDTLYQPYTGIERIAGLAAQQFNAIAVGNFWFDRKS